MRADQQEVLHRFHRTLVRELKNRDEWDPSAPLTVAEIYRDLVPHHNNGIELGFARDTDYEVVLLRLLSGEGGYVSVASQQASQEFRDELDSPTPDTGLYRDFAGVAVHLNLDRVD